jgi:hypothetical protein
MERTDIKMNYRLAVCLVLVLAALGGSLAFAQVQISVGVAPPPIAVFDQPPCPGDDYIWTPGYYQYGNYGYYWVQGQWVIPPSAGLLWTPGYWGFAGRRFTWYEGHWGRQVGFYGGVNYGNGYFGAGFTGGRWEGRVFRHNTAISNVDRNNVRNTYEDRSVLRDARGPNHAFNGKHGINARPSREDMEVSRTPHQGPTPAQVSHAQQAHSHQMAAHGAGHR